jgi:hypothetical protein
MVTYICPVCRKEIDKLEGAYYCDDCLEKGILVIMLRKAENISKMLQGKRIVAVGYSEFDAERIHPDRECVDVDGGSIWILLDDGTHLIAWSSETGAVYLSYPSDFWVSVKVDEKEKEEIKKMQKESD